jgi:hypothetical protein
VLNDVAMEHEHARVIGELKLELESFPGSKVPRLFHRFIGVTRSSISTDALLRDVVNVYGMGFSRGVRKDPFLGGAEHRAGIDSVGIEP